VLNVTPALSDWQSALRPKAAAGDRQAWLVLGFGLGIAAAVGIGVETRLDVALGVAGLLTAAGAWFLAGRTTALLTAFAVIAIAIAGEIRDVPVSVRVVEATITVVMAALSHLSAASLSSSRLAIEHERQVRELTFLLDAAQNLAGSLDSDVIIATAVDATLERVSRGAPGRAARASFHELTGEQVRVAVIRDLEANSSEEVGLTYPLAANQAATGALRSGRAALVRPDHLSGELLDLALHHGVLVYALAPVRSGNRTFGFLAATAKDRPYFDRDELRRLEILAHMTGLAIGNAEHLRREQAHSERAAALERTKSELLNLVSHELRGPLTVIRGYISMLEEGEFGTLPPAYRQEILPILEGKLTSMDLLVEQTLEASRLEDSRLLLKKERVDFTEVATLAIETTRPLAGRRHRLTLDATSEPVPVDGDRDRLATILTNLIDNAIKYSPDGGVVECRVWRERDHVLFSVRDHGLGIARDDLPRLFTRFGRIVTADNSHIPGTGLGLYLCQELARMHGGRISVTSEVRRGSTFTLQLPAAVAQPVGAASNSPRTKSRISSEKGASSSAGGV
jgi:signal transduction histidine kinase